MTIKHVDIVGLGWLGFPLGLHLKQLGLKVSGTTTSPIKREELNAQGLQAREFKLGERFATTEAELVIVNIPSKDVEAFRQLSDALSKSACTYVLFVSSTSVYPSNAGIVHEEAATVADHPLVTIEQLFQNCPSFSTTILRFAGLIGGTRRPGKFFKNGRMIPNPNGKVNMIHLKDCIGLIAGLLESNMPIGIFNGASDIHPTRSDYYRHVFAQEGRDAPKFEEYDQVNTKVVDNTKIKKLLGYDFIHPNPMDIEVC